MSFFDTYVDKGAGGRFMAAADKQVLIENGIPFDITGITWDPENEHGARFIAYVTVPDPETGENESRKIGFPVGTGVDTRDDMLREMKKYLDEGGDPVTVKLDKPGRAIFITKA